MMEDLGEHDHPAHDEEPIAAQGTDSADASPAGDASESKDGMELAVQKGDADILDKDSEKIAKHLGNEEERRLMLNETFTLTVDQDVESNSEGASTEGRLEPPRAAGITVVDDDKYYEESKEREAGVTDAEHDQLSQTDRSGAKAVEGDLTATGRRPHSPTTQAAERQVRKMMQGLTSSIETATAALTESLMEVSGHLTKDLADSESITCGQLQAMHKENSRKASLWLTRHQRGLDEVAIDEFELRLDAVDNRNHEIVLKAFQDQRAAAERRIREMVDVVASAFDDHLDDLTSALKHQFRWIKRCYREKIDVNRNASKIELKDTLLLDRCILEETKRDIDLRHEEELARLRVEFQLEGSVTRKKLRELEQFVEMLKLRKLQAEQDLAQAHRYIEALEEEVEAAHHTATYSEDGSVGGPRSSRRTTRASPRSIGNLSPRGGSRSASPRHLSAMAGGGQKSRQLSSTKSTHNVFSAGGGGGGGGTKSAGVGGGGGGIRQEQLSARGSARGLISSGKAAPTSARGMLSGRRHSGKLGVAGGVGVLERKHTARGAEPDSARSTIIAGGLSTGRALGSGRGEGRMRGGLFNEGGGENDPAARHEEARMRFEHDVARKLRRVIEKKKVENLKEELADEAVTRGATQARLELLEKALPKLQEALKKAQEQLVQSRMETNELRKMNTMMTSDLENEADRVKREEEERAANAAALLAESTANSPGRGNSRRRSMKQQSPDKSRTQSSFRAAGGGNREPGSPVGSRRGTIADRMAKEMEAKGMQQWVVPCSSSNGRGESSSSSSTEEDGEKERGEDDMDDDASGTEDLGKLRKNMAKLRLQVKELTKEKTTAVEEAAKLREEVKAKEAAVLVEAGKASENGHPGPKTQAAARLQLIYLSQAKTDLESKVARLQVASDENQYLRRRLEAFERTALKLNLPGSKGGSQGVNENLEPSEITRLRDTAHALEADKVALSQEIAKLKEESVSQEQLEKVRSAAVEQITLLEARHGEKVACLEQELEELNRFKAEMTNLADGSFESSDSDGLDVGSDGGDGRDMRQTKWKQRAKRLQQYAKWQLAASETRACREKAEMSLKIRSNETMMGEMAVLVRRYRHECALLHKVNRTLNDRLAEYQLQPVLPRALSVSSRTDRAGPNVDPPRPKFGNLGWCKKRDRNGGLRNGGVSPVGPSPASVPCVAVHTLDSTRGGLIRGGVAAIAEVNQRRPQTSTGCGGRRKLGLDAHCDRGRSTSAATRKEARMSACAIARELRSRVRDEFLGRPEDNGAGERRKDMDAATARYTTREGMVLARPLSPVTGSIRTNVDLPGGDDGRLEGNTAMARGILGRLGQVETESGGVLW